MAPAFVVTDCDSTALYRTAQEKYFSTNFLDWQSRIEWSYQVVSEGLDKVWGHSIVSHKCLQNGLIQVDYNNGVSILLNYTQKPLSYDGVKVEAKWFTVIGG